MRFCWSVLAFALALAPSAVSASFNSAHSRIDIAVHNPSEEENNARDHSLYASLVIPAPAAAQGSEENQERNNDTAQHNESSPVLMFFLGLWDIWTERTIEVLTAAGLLISAWAVWLLSRTLKATLVAVRQGEHATKAAIKASAAAIEANQILRSEQRPWIAVECQDIVEAFENSDSFRVESEIKLTNFGRTPAVNVIMDYAVFWRSSANPETVAKNLISTSEKPVGQHGLAIFPGKSHEATINLTYAKSLVEGDPSGMLGIIVNVSYGSFSSSERFHTSIYLRGFRRSAGDEEGKVVHSLHSNGGNYLVAIE